MMLMLQAMQGSLAPVWPVRWHVQFNESTHGYSSANTTYNSGSLHYDFANDRQLFSHGDGQTDNWCQCAGLKTTSHCDLYSIKGAMYAAFPSEKKCCKVNEGIGFGPLRPNWLQMSEATNTGTTEVAGRNCSVWSTPHPGDKYTMKADVWSQDAQGVPCTYTDIFKSIYPMTHQLVFNKPTFSTAAEADTVFELPDTLASACEQDCPNKMGWCNAR